MTRSEYVQKKSGFCRAQEALESVYSAAMRNLFQKPSNYKNNPIKVSIWTTRILQARRRLRREYQCAVRAYEKKQMETTQKTKQIEKELRV